MSKVCLGDVAVEVRETIKDSVGMPVVGLEHLVPGEIELSQWSEGNDNTFTRAFRKGQILFGRRRAYQKKASVATIDGVCSGDITVIAAKEDRILPKLLPFIVNDEKFFDYAMEKSAGSLSPRVKWAQLAEYTFELPDDTEKQGEISSLLWAMERSRKAYRALLKQTDDVVKSQFVEMCEGEIKRPIREICIRYGRGKAPNYVDHSNVRVINQACIYWDGLHFDNVKYQNEELFKEENKLFNGAVLLNATGTGTLGRSCVFTEADGVYMADGHVSIFYTDPTLMYPRFLQVFFSLPETQKHIYSECVNGSTNQIELSREKIGCLLIPTPTLAKQKAFMELVEQIDKSKLAIQQSLDTLEKTKKSIMNSIFG